MQANAGQQDVDGDGSGDACDFGIAAPLADVLLDCSDSPSRPVISWNPGDYDRYRVEIGWIPDFSGKVTSGDTLLKVHSWSPGRTKWKKVCDRALGSISIRVFGVDKNRPKIDPARKTYTPVVTPGIQH